MDARASSAPPAFTLPAALASQGLHLRPETDDDIPFLQRLYASTRAEELKVVPWSEEQKQAFLVDQFRAQRLHYRQHFKSCAFDVIERCGQPAGRLYLEPRGSRLHVVDITLMPEWRGQGIGTAILRALQESARAQGLRVGIMVEVFNPARRLYDRLGFVETANHGVYLEMEWRCQESEIRDQSSVSAEPMNNL